MEQEEGFTLLCLNQGYDIVGLIALVITRADRTGLDPVDEEAFPRLGILSDLDSCYPLEFLELIESECRDKC